MQKIWIDGERIRDAAHFHDWLAAALKLPDYYGRNPDALLDCLSELEEETELVLVNRALLEEKLGAAGGALLKALQYAEEDGSVTLKFMD